MLTGGVAVPFEGPVEGDEAVGCWEMETVFVVGS